MKVRQVRLGFDDSYFTGPSVNPQWPATYIPEDVVPPISALWVDEGQEPDGYGFVADPAAAAASDVPLRADLGGDEGRPPGTSHEHPDRRDRGGLGGERPAGRDRRADPGGQRQPGRRGAGSPRRAGRAPGGLVPGRRGRGPRGAAAPRRTRRGGQLYDGSGLSRQDLLGTDTLAAVVRLVASRDHPELRQVLTGLPVAGFTGSLTYRFAQGSRRRPWPGAREDRHPDRGARAGRSRRRRDRCADGVRRGRRPGRAAQGARGTDADRPDRRRVGRVQVRRRVSTMSAERPSRPGMVDWDLAVRVGSRLVGEGPQVSRSEAVDAVEELRAGAARSTPLVREFTGLVATERTAPVLVVDRPGWVQAQRRRLRHRDRTADRQAPGEEGRTRPGDGGDRLPDHRRRARGDARASSAPRCSASSTPSTRSRASRGACCWSRPTSCTWSASCRPTPTTSGCGSASTRRPTGCSSPRSRG